MQQISLKPEILVNNEFFTLTNAHLGSLFVLLIIFVVLIKLKNNISIIPSKLQVIFEFAVGYFYERSLEVEKNKKNAKKFTSLVVSVFLFVFIANQFSLIPLVNSLTVNGISAFKTPTAHFSLTISLALIVVFLSNYIAFTVSPIDHLNSFVNFKSIKKTSSLKELPSVFLELFLGVLNIVGEFAKVISLSARLFGNIFAGEVMVIIIAGLSICTAYLLPIPFIVISIFSGIIQAFVFAFLSFSFLTSGVKSAS